MKAPVATPAFFFIGPGKRLAETACLRPASGEPALRRVKSDPA